MSTKQAGNEIGSAVDNAIDAGRKMGEDAGVLKSPGERVADAIGDGARRIGEDVGVVRTPGEKARDAVVNAGHKVGDVARDASHKTAEAARQAGDKAREGTRVAKDYAKDHPGTVAAVVGGVIAAGAALFGAKWYRDSQRKAEARAELDKVGFPEMRAGRPEVKMDEKA